MYVDSASRGGGCSDGRIASQVSVTSPLCSIPRATELVADGGTILVRGATYPKLMFDRAYGEKVTIKAYPSEQPELQGVGLGAAARRVRIENFRISDITQVDGQYIELVGNDISPHGVGLGGSNNLAEKNYVHDLRIVFDESSTAERCHSAWRLDGENDKDHDGQYDYPLSRTGGIAPWCGHAFRTKGSNNAIRGNVVRKVPADGIQAIDTTDLLVEGNRFENIAVQSSADGGDPLEHPDGAQVIGQNRNAVFRNNVYVDTRGILSMLYKDNTWPSNLTVENNVFHTTPEYTGSTMGCIHASAVTGMTIINNTCWGDGDFDPRVRLTDGTPTTSHVSETTGVVVKNNIIERYATESGVNVTEDHNLIRRFEAAPGQSLGSHSRVGEPTFVPGDLFLHLAPGSEGIDAGTSEGAPDRDREGALRCDELSIPNTGAGSQPYFDLGAHEFGSGAATCTARPSYADAIVADRPVSYWRVGEPSGTAANDRMALNRGSYRGGFTLGQPGAVAGDTAVRLNGTSGYVHVLDSPSLHTGDNFSVETWLKLGRLRATQALIGKGGSYLVWLDSANYLNLRKPGSANIARSTIPISDTTSYHHVVVAKAGPSTRLYIDGVNRTGTVANRTIPSTTSPLLIGTGAGYLSGTLDEITLYSRALTASEVASHYAAR